MPKQIVALIADLMFQLRVESAAEKLGYQVHWIESEQNLMCDTGELPIGRHKERYIVDTIAQLNPDLTIFDLGNEEIPWKVWIPAVKARPETEQIPVICYGSHVDVEAIQTARKLGANAVVARSRFVTALPDLIRKYTQK